MDPGPIVVGRLLLLERGLFFTGLAGVEDDAVDEMACSGWRILRRIADPQGTGGGRRSEESFYVVHSSECDSLAIGPRDNIFAFFETQVCIVL